MKCPMSVSQSGYAMQECERSCAWYVDGKCAIVKIAEKCDNLDQRVTEYVVSVE